MRIRKELIISFMILLAVVATTVLVEGLEGPKRYLNKVLEHRSRTEKFMKYSEDSPFIETMKVSFNGLEYFPPNSDYRIIAKLSFANLKNTITVPTSTGVTRLYTPYAYAEFILKGEEHRLLLLKEEGESSSNRLFLAFMDKSSGRETYAGGRYIDLYLQKAEEIVIDFNFAYNPYCVYNLTFSCPLPPPENRLSVSIQAGEKLYLSPEG